MADDANGKRKNIDPRKLTILLELAKEAEGKSMDQLLPLMMSTTGKLKEQNLSFSTDESNLMIELLTKNLSKKEKQQFEMIKKFMSTNN